MDTLDLERLAYLYLADARERRILLEKEPMKFYDFRRHVFLTGFLGFHNYSLYLWNHFSGHFDEQFDAIVDMIMEEGDFYPDLEFSFEEEEKWLENMCRHAPKSEQKWLRKQIRKKRMEKEK